MPENETTTPNDAPSTTLVVVQPFHGHQRGDAITDPDEVAEILGGELADHVVKRAG
jgi:hypothetical protein